MRKNIMLLSLLFMLFSSCNPDRGFFLQPRDTYVPVYASAESVSQIEVEDKKPTIEAGKIYVYENYIFQNELNAGIHIINNTDRKHPVKVAFLKVPMSSEIAVKGHFLYTNNNKDLVIFNISDPGSPHLVKRMADVFPGLSQRYPPFLGVYFECPDPSKGIVIKWEKKDIPEPKCRR